MTAQPTHARATTVAMAMLLFALGGCTSPAEPPELEPGPGAGDRGDGAIADAGDRRSDAGGEVGDRVDAARDRPDAAADLPGLRALGTATVESGPSPCDGADCYVVWVSCPGVAEDMSFDLRVGEPSGTSRGTVLFATGGSGSALWSRKELAGQTLLALNDAGFRTAEIGWRGRWWDGSSVDEGAAVVACRVATAADWIHRTLHDGDGFCAVGTSGGAAQVSYLLTHYGLDDRLDLVVPVEGPPFARIDLGCLPSEGDPPALDYGPPSQRTGRFDASYGWDDRAAYDGPCSSNDETFRTRFEDASLAHGDRDFDHPTTRIRFLFGDEGNENAQAQGLSYLERLMELPTNDVSLTTAPGDHGVAVESPAGSAALRDMIVAECAPTASR